MRMILLAAVAALGLTAPAMAADMTSHGVRDWSGSYVGLQVGAAFGDSRHTDTVGVTTGDFRISGAVGGYTTGYNWQDGALVFGFEGDTSLANVDGATTVLCPATCYSRLRWVSTYRARLGWATGDLLAYVTGGFAMGGVRAGFVTAPFATRDTRTGWTAGLGLEAALSDTLSAKVEYQRLDLGKATYVVGIPVHADFSKINVVRVGLNYKFSIFDYLGR